MCNYLVYNDHRTLVYVYRDYCDRSSSRDFLSLEIKKSKRNCNMYTIFIRFMEAVGGRRGNAFIFQVAFAVKYLRNIMIMEASFTCSRVLISFLHTSV